MSLSPNPSPTDFEPHAERRLLRRMTRGDEVAFDTFIARYTPVIVRYAQAHHDDPASVEDLVQTTLAIAVDRLDGFRGDGPLGAWLLGICRHRIGSERRRRAVRRRHAADGPVDLERVEAPDADQAAAFARRELRATVHATLEQLAPPYGDVLHWKYLDELSVAAIADRLDTSPKAAESMLTRARTAFRRVFDASTDQEPHDVQ